jgi:PAS domain S-box-containing protein
MSPQYTFTGFKDISSREQLIVELKNSNKLLSSIIEFYPDAMLIIDNYGRVIAWNKAIEEMTGVKAEEMIGKGDYEYALPFYGQRKPLLLNMLDVPPAEINGRYKDTRIRNDRLEALAVKAKIKGKDAIIWATASKLYDAEGNVVGAIESIRDVTGQKIAEEARRESEQRLADIIDFLPDATFAIDRDGKVVAWNRAIEDMTGVKAEVMLGKGDYEYAVPFYGARRPILIDLAFRYDGEIEKNYSYVKKEGSALLAETETYLKGGARALLGKAVPLYDSRGNIAGAIESIRDISDRKQALGELERHKDHLEKLIAERTANLSEVNEALHKEIAERRRSEGALKEAKAEAELYLDLMGHDINNLNQICLGFLEMALEMPGLNDGARSLLSRPLAALESSSRLIDNVRKLQKARSGELCQMEIDVGRALSGVRANYSHIPGSDITINYASVRGCVVMADELLYDVFSNLVGNAIKHSARIPVINIGLGEELIGGILHYRVTVEDNGPGIPDELKLRIFNRHLRGSTKAKGSGIGLYLVKTLVEGYGGRVWVEDRIPGNMGEGSRFVVMLPACETPK